MRIILYTLSTSCKNKYVHVPEFNDLYSKLLLRNFLFNMNHYPKCSFAQFFPKFVLSFKAEDKKCNRETNLVVLADHSYCTNLIKLHVNTKGPLEELHVYIYLNVTNFMGINNICDS